MQNNASTPCCSSPVLSLFLCMLTLICFTAVVVVSLVLTENKCPCTAPDDLRINEECCAEQIDGFSICSSKQCVCFTPTIEYILDPGSEPTDEENFECKPKKKQMTSVAVAVSVVVGIVGIGFLAAACGSCCCDEPNERPQQTQSARTPVNIVSGNPLPTHYIT